jgi:acetyl-CoA acetyltransferase
VATRKHAQQNPDAIFHGKTMSLEDHQASRWIVHPLHLLDCCLETDGGAACVVTSVERAKDLKQKPAIIRGVAQAAGDDQEVMTSFYREKMAAIPEMDRVAQRVWQTSGLSAKDVDAAVIYDAFTSIVLWQLESFGFCKPGESKDFDKDGNLALGGRLPTNTHGGQLSEAYIHGMNGVNEGVRLIRGDSRNQPKQCEHVLVTAGIGVPTSAMVLGHV